MQSRAQLVPFQHPDYPPLLTATERCPTVLFVLGNIQLLQFPQIAMVGSRNPSSSGKRTARAFAQELASAGLCITSGLALGIDTESHLGAQAAQGKTIAVTGTGLDRVYPAKNRDLAHQISKHGAIVSEFPPGTPPIPGNFPRRNRVISGLSTGTLVVEAAMQSGSLITARYAAEQGREVFAIPGSIHNPLARGCHNLIRNGAKLVETAADVLEELSGLLSLAPPPTQPIASEVEELPLEPDHQELLEAMGYDPVSADFLVEHTRFEPAEISSMLLLLEMAGHVSSAPGGLYLRA
ncbi:MAG: DNA-processing protein DprA [bacterium]